MGVQVPPAAPASPRLSLPDGMVRFVPSPAAAVFSCFVSVGRAVRMSATLPEPVPRKRHSVRNQIFLAILFGLLIAFSATYVQLMLERAEVRAELDRSSSKYAEATQRGLRLAQQLEYVKTDAYRETVARDKLGLSRPGDQVVAVILPRGYSHTGSGLLPQTQETSVLDLPIWEQWFALFNIEIDLS